MNFELFKTIVNGFYTLNAIPIFVICNQKIIFSTIPKQYLVKNTAEFLLHFTTASITVFGDIEFYAAFSYSTEDVTYTVVAGPMFSAHPMSVGYKGKLAVEEILDNSKLKDFLISIKITGEESFLQYVEILSQMTGNGHINTTNYIKKKISLQAVLDQHITKDVFLAREHMLSPYAPEAEKRIMDMVRAGDVEFVKKINTTLVADAPGHKVNYLFKIVSLVTICTRAVLDSGVDATVAFTLSDRYLQMLGMAKNNTQVSDIAKNVLPHFANLVAEKKEKNSYKYSPHLIKAESYIKQHLHYKFSLNDVAENVGVSKKYLSRLFVTHKGEKFSKYVNRCRILEAKELLLNTDTSLTNISYSLGFVSESYFISIFKDFCNTTPNNYRKKYKSMN